MCVYVCVRRSERERAGYLTAYCVYTVGFYGILLICASTTKAGAAWKKKKDGKRKSSVRINTGAKVTLCCEPIRDLTAAPSFSAATILELVLSALLLIYYSA